MFGRYTIYSENDFAGTNSQSPYDGFNTGQTLFNQNVMLSVTHVFSPNVVMSLKGIYNRLNNQQPLGPQGVVPQPVLLSSGISVRWVEPDRTSWIPALQSGQCYPLRWSAKRLRGER